MNRETKQALIIGAGISGCSAGYELALRGINVDIIDTASRIGGKVVNYFCKATSDCSGCGVCLAHTQLKNAALHERIRITPAASVKRISDGPEGITLTLDRKNPTLDNKKCIECNQCLESCPVSCISKYSRGGFSHYYFDLAECLLQQGQRCTACADSCPTGAIYAGEGQTTVTLPTDVMIIATGHEPYQAEREARFGYGRLRNVISGQDAEEILTGHLSLDEGVRKIAFIQCVGSRNPKIGRNYCSGVCCAYALRIAQVLKYRKSDLDITIYYIDLQNFDKTFTLFKNKLERMGINFVRSIPLDIRQSSDGGLKLRLENAAGGTTEIKHDMVVLSVGMGPDAEAGNVAELFQLKKDEFGFFSSTKSNTFVCGTCAEPQGIMSCITAAKAAANEALKYLTNRDHGK